MEIYNDKYREVSFEADTKILHQIWHKATEDMTIEEYKEASLSLANEVKNHRATRILNNAVDSLFVVTPEIQDWVNKNVVSQFLQAGLQKYAIILPSELFTQVSIEQIVDDTQEVAQKRINYFDDEAKAREWLLN